MNAWEKEQRRIHGKLYKPFSERNIPFSSNWSKLGDEQFTTIRKKKMAIVSENRIIYPYTVINRVTNETFKVECTRIEKVALGEIPIELLLKDTDSKTRDEAIAKIQKFYYKSLTDETVFYIHYLKKKSPGAKPCAKCGGYYPGDCTCGYNCDCDGCKTLRHMEDPENHVCCFNNTSGDVEKCYDVESEHYGKVGLIMYCDCGEEELQFWGDDSEEECVEPTLGYNVDDLGCV